jgi:hypothetical protein
VSAAFLPYFFTITLTSSLLKAIVFLLSFVVHGKD